MRGFAYVALFVLVGLGGLVCKAQPWDKIPDNFNSSSLGYFQDYRTGLCFAYATSSTTDNFDVVSISEVPCNGKVLNLAKFPTESRDER